MTRTPRMDPEALGVLRRFFEAQNTRLKKAGMAELQVKVDAKGNVDTAPSRPGSIKVTQADGGLTLMWKPSKDDRGGIAAYRIYRDGKPYATVRGSTWFTDAKAKGPHDYEVRAIDRSGLEGAPERLPLKAQAAEAAAAQAQQQAQAGANGAAQPGAGAPQATAGAGQLQAPAYTSLKQPDRESIQLGWNAVPGAVAYGVYQDGKLVGHVQDPTFGAKVTSKSGTVLEIDAVTADGKRSPRGQAIAMRVGEKGVELAPLPAAQSAGAPAGQQQGQGQPQGQQGAPAAPGQPAPVTEPPAPTTAASPSAAPATAATATPAESPTGAASPQPAATTAPAPMPTRSPEPAGAAGPQPAPAPSQ